LLIASIITKSVYYKIMYWQTHTTKGERHA
jgi:hypothetical protein